MPSVSSTDPPVDEPESDMDVTYRLPLRGPETLRSRPLDLLVSASCLGDSPTPIVEYVPTQTDI